MIAYQAVSEVMQICDECENAVVRILRVYKGRKYCASCYIRVFKQKTCPACGNYARLNKYDSNAICPACVRAKPCARCEKTNYKTGKLTPYGMVCNSCAPHFRNKEPCEICGATSNRLSKISRLGHSLRVCPKCQRIDHATCQACKRHRLLSLSKGGRMLCKTCLELGEVPCTKCTQLMPAGYGKTCEACYWQGLLDKRTTINCASFKLESMSVHFKAFSGWLGIKVGCHKAAVTLNHYLPFFVAVEKQFSEILNYDLLLNHFGAAKLRKVLLPMQWMEASGLVTVNVITREDNTEKRRIEALLNKLGDKTKARNLADGYYRLLHEDLERNKTTLRSIRLVLSPCVSLLLRSAEMSLTPPNQKALNAYLAKSSGQRSAISGFICHLRNVHCVEIQLPKLDKNKAQRNRRKKLETQILALMKAGKANTENREWLSVALAYFHGLPKRVGKTIASENIIDTANGGVTVSWNGLRYWLKTN